MQKPSSRRVRGAAWHALHLQLSVSQPRRAQAPLAGSCGGCLVAAFGQSSASPRRRAARSGTEAAASRPPSSDTAEGPMAAQDAKRRGVWAAKWQLSAGACSRMHGDFGARPASTASRPMPAWSSWTANGGGVGARCQPDGDSNRRRFWFWPAGRTDDDCSHSIGCLWNQAGGWLDRRPRVSAFSGFPGVPAMRQAWPTEGICGR
ncbi:hypothetical protein CDD83_10644 [Cordyceps sp. RAO-2017]|nr:hypothetical protein CDD83_10644 [Cordyceps sp. RAO-2017]